MTELSKQKKAEGHQTSILLKDQRLEAPSDLKVEHIEVPGLEEPTQRYGQIYLTPLFSRTDSASLRGMVPRLSSSAVVVGLDFYVAGHEKATELRNAAGMLLGFKYPDNTLNIDHHAPVLEMAHPISTATLVTSYVREQGAIANHDSALIINHSDADSILSSLLLAGKLDAFDPQFSQAAVDADHTGRKNTIADLLVALESKRDLQFSIYCLNKLLRNEPLPNEAQVLLAERQSQREEALQLIQSGLMQNIGNGVYLIESKQSLRSEFFPPAKEDAAIFVIANPEENGWEYKVRAGNALPPRKRLNEMDIPYFGGRWNAGGTKRQGTVPIAPQTYAQLIAKKLQ